LTSFATTIISQMPSSLQGGRGEGWRQEGTVT